MSGRGGGAHGCGFCPDLIAPCYQPPHLCEGQSQCKDGDESGLPLMKSRSPWWFDGVRDTDEWQVNECCSSSCHTSVSCLRLLDRCGSLNQGGRKIHKWLLCLPVDWNGTVGVSWFNTVVTQLGITQTDIHLNLLRLVHLLQNVLFTGVFVVYFATDN